MAFTDEQPFLDSIFAQYAEDGPRLVYADYLEDSGDPERAELIRIQLLLERMTPEHPRRTELNDQLSDLLVRNGSRWTEHFGDWVAGVEFRRGIPDSVSLDATRFLEVGDALFQQQRIYRVRLLEAAPLLPKLAASPLFRQVRELDLCGNDLGKDGVRVLLNSPHLQTLQSLDLGFNGLDDRAVAALAGASTLPALTALYLNDNGQITSDGIRELARSPFYGGLTRLDISGNDINESGVEAIVASPGLAHLHHLRVIGNRIGDAGVTALARSTLLNRMVQQDRRIELFGNAIGSVGVAELLHGLGDSRCVVLDLTGNDLGDLGFAILVQSGRLAHLRVLKLGRNKITDAGVNSVRGKLAHWMSRLTHLDLSHNRFTRQGMGLLLAARGDRHMNLDLSANVQTASGGETPVRLGELMPALIQGAAEAAEQAELRRRIAYPALRTGERNQPPR